MICFVFTTYQNLCVINFVVDKADYVELHQNLAKALSGKMSGNCFAIPENAGKGFVWAEKLPWGVTMMVSETTMREDFLFTCEVRSEYAYCLQFNDAHTDVIKKDFRNRNANPVQTSVTITDTLFPISYHFPMGTTLRSVKLFFTREHLIQLLGKPEIEHVISQYFSFLIKNKSLAPIDTGYRITLDELLMEKISHPLRLNYLQNRALLLIEKFLVKLHSKKDILFTKLKNNDDEITRLMRVEALLVKDFALTPPTISELSRISAMSPTKLKTDFKSLYGLPIYEYYQKNRMLKAKSLLMLMKYSIKEVGIMVGYSNLSHFANTFKKEFGILPSEMTSKDGMLVYGS